VLRHGAAFRHKDVLEMIRMKKNPYPYWVAIAAGLTVLWAMELFLVQEFTLFPNYPYVGYKWMVSRCLRLALDLLFCAFCITLCYRMVLYGIFALNVLGSTAIIAYSEYFNHSLSLNTMLYQGAEGAQVGAYAIQLVNWWAFAGLLLGLTVKIAVYEKTGGVKLRTRRRLVSAMLILLVYLGIVGGTNLYVDPLRKLKGFGTVGRLGLTYGYLWTWAGEVWYLKNDSLLKRAVEAARQETDDRLTSVEYPLSMQGDVVILQLESLEFAVLDHRVNDQPVTPFLNQLKEKSFFYKIEAVHEHGSADADFTMLTGVKPSPDIVTYKIKDYPYGETLARRAREKGYVTSVFHGASGTFFERRSGFERMGLYPFYFEEEMVRDFGLRADKWGIKDHDVFDLSLRLLKKNARQKSIHFIITLTSHGPWDYLDRQEMEIFKHPETIEENYLNSMRYLDRAVGNYITRLREHTTVVLYGDHESRVGYTQRNKGRDGKEWVPLMIYRVGEDISPIQRTRTRKIATSGELDFLEATRYVWSCILR